MKLLMIISLVFLHPPRIVMGNKSDCQDHFDEVEIVRASESGDVKRVECLLLKGAHIDSQDKDGWTPLHMAAWYNHFELAQILIQNKANLNVRSETGWTPIMAGTRCTKV